MRDDPKNPAAFPMTGEGFGSPLYSQHGMSLRDYFAIHAPEPPMSWWGGDMITCAGYALWNYQYADTMLAERAKVAQS